jgi:predicted GNAT family acetyltransferase
MTEATSNDPIVTLRSASSEDDPFLLAVFASARVSELESLPPNEELRRVFLRTQFAAQRSHYRTHYPRAEDCVILVAGRRAGRLYVSRSPDEIRVLDVVILPEHRNAGAGTKLLRGLMAEAAHAGVPVRLYVELFNPSRRLFDRLGFVAAAETGFHVLLEWRAAASDREAHAG